MAQESRRDDARNAAKATAQIQADRERLRHEMDIAKDQERLKELWEQTANLATLISVRWLADP